RDRRPRVRTRRYSGPDRGRARRHGTGRPFPRHVERCRVLLHLVDGTVEHAGVAYKTVRAELKAYGQGLGEKPEVVALNKADALMPDELKRQTARLERAAKKTPLVVSAATGVGVPDVLRALLRVIDKTQHQERPSLAAKAWHTTRRLIRL